LYGYLKAHLATESDIYKAMGQVLKYDPNSGVFSDPASPTKNWGAFKDCIPQPGTQALTSATRPLRKDPGIGWSRVSQNLGDNKKNTLG
jgi:hypothetical protein